jgi:pimeloyl-ACP methyl ester carboxylesterase
VIATVHGSDLYYEVHGDAGDPVALLHGSWVDHHSWDLVVPGFSRALVTLTYDRRGHGESRGPSRAHPVRDDAEDLAGLLEAADLYPAHLVAHSYGGAVALRLAADRPEMVRSVTIHEPTFVGLLADDPAGAAEAERLVEGVRGLQSLVRAGARERAASTFVDQFSSEPGAWQRLPSGVRATFLANADRWVEEFDDPDAFAPDRAACRELLIPALLTVGGQSPRFLYRITDALAGLLRNHRFLSIPDVGHAPHLVQPDQYVGIVGSFLLERNVPST